MDSSIKEKVFEVVKTIPHGKVATYDQVAKLIHSKRHSWSVPGKNYAHSGSVARAVGNVLHQNKNPNVPCHRVVDRNGRLAPNFAGPPKPWRRRAFDGAKEQRKRLEAEGVKFVDKMHVNLSKCIWRENSKSQAPSSKQYLNSN